MPFLIFIDMNICTKEGEIKMKKLIKKLVVLTSLIVGGKVFAAQNDVVMVKISSDDQLNLDALENLGFVKANLSKDKKQIVFTIEDDQNFSLDNFLNSLEAQIGDDSKINKISIEAMSVGTQDWTRQK